LVNIKEEEIEKLCFIEGCCHIDYTTEIFSFFSFMANNTHNVIFDEPSLNLLYNMFVENPASTKEINLFFVLHFLRIKIEIVKKKTLQRLRCQYLYFWPSKAGKLHTAAAPAWKSARV
jgi:hypothetical protein